MVNPGHDLVFCSHPPILKATASQKSHIFTF